MRIFEHIKNTDMDLLKITNIEVEGVDLNDYPDFSDAYISNADYEGEQMTNEQIEQINQDSEFVYNSVLNYLF